jgi:hypothetical protein
LQLVRQSPSGQQLAGLAQLPPFSQVGSSISLVSMQRHPSSAIKEASSSGSRRFIA